MSPLPLLQYSIHNILQYISPPSHIMEFLPSHLISISLQQRHRFLNISPSSPEYLCWPSINTATTIGLLESFVRPADDDEYASYPVRYSSDGEWVYAQVHVSSGHGDLRIVFQWDETDGWKYHDANVMPFPHGSYTSLQEAISGSSSHLDQAKFSDDCLPENGVGSVDDYWDAYDQASDEDRSDIFHVKEDNNQDDTEDSYWAQYASIQGSGDSTQPSPGPHARRKLHSFGGINPAYDPDNASDSPIIFSHTSFLPRFPDEGPSPGMLIDRLNAISPRCPSSLPFKDSEPTTPSLPSADTATGLNPDRDLVILNANNASSGLEEIEEALRQSIRGALMLWKAGRRRCFVTPSASQQEDNEIFLRIVKQTVEDT